LPEAGVVAVGVGELGGAALGVDELGAVALGVGAFDGEADFVAEAVLLDDVPHDAKMTIPTTATSEAPNLMICISCEVV